MIKYNDVLACPPDEHRPIMMTTMKVLLVDRDSILQDPMIVYYMADFLNYDYQEGCVGYRYIAFSHSAYVIIQ